MSYFTCTGCPRRCSVSVYEEDGQLYTKGNNCNTGHGLALRDYFNPNTSFNELIKLNGKRKMYLNVAATEQIPKEIVPDLKALLKTLEISPPVRRGDVIIKNVFETGVDIIADNSTH